MEHAREGDLVVVRLDRGEDFVEGILSALKAHKATGAVVLTCLGAVEDVDFGYFDPSTKVYDRKVEKVSHEVLGLSGIVASAPDGSFQPHFHITLGGPDHVAVGGHLFKARVAVLAELALRVVDKPRLTREEEPQFGLNALHCR